MTVRPVSFSVTPPIWRSRELLQRTEHFGPRRQQKVVKIVQCGEQYIPALWRQPCGVNLTQVDFLSEAIIHFRVDFMGQLGALTA